MMWTMRKLRQQLALRLMCLLVSTVMAAEASALGGQAAPGEDLVLIPAGPFVMGSDKEPSQDESTGVGMVKPWYLDEHPSHEVVLSAYAIDRYEVTDAQYQSFVMATGHAPPMIWGRNGYLLELRLKEISQLDVEILRRLAVKTFKLDMDTSTMDKQALLDAIIARLHYLEKEPVTDVSWYDAQAYCSWAGGRLPREAEWEKAARGNEGNEFPWGSQWSGGLSNSGEEVWDDGVAPVGSYATDKSPSGVFDLAGNVSEWVQDWYQPYPGASYQSDAFGEKFKVLRGAAWGREGHYAMHQFQRGAYRFYQDPDATLDDVGFRCAKDAGVVASTPP